MTCILNSVVLQQHKHQCIERERNLLEDHVIGKLGPGGDSQEFRRNVVGRHIVAQEECRLAPEPQPVPDWGWSGVRGL
jgi:hypothetical protein